MFGANWLAYVRGMTASKPKIALIVSTALQVQFFLKPHLRALADSASKFDTLSRTDTPER